MGADPVCNVDDLPEDLLNGFDPNPKISQSKTTVGNKTYVVDDTHDGRALSIRIFHKSTDKWVIPTVLGTKPESGNGHSAVLLNDDRILIIKWGSTFDDGIWFLEVDTKFVRRQKEILGTDVVAWSKGVVGDAKKPIVISGPSGVGKGTLITKLMKEFPSMFGFSVSHTTRAPRDKESDGVHYHFTERSLMEEDIKGGKFLEFANVHGNLYGTSIEAVEVVADAGKRCILDIDVQGAKSVRASSLEAIFIFILPPSFVELEKRLRERGTETEEQIQKRLLNAKAELEQGISTGLFDHILVNDDLDKCYENLKKLLDLDGKEADTLSKPPSKPVELPVGHQSHLVLKIDCKVVIGSRSEELERASKNLMVMDISSLKGGAPGRTRGLRLIDSMSDALNVGTEHLSKYVKA